jgi:Fe-Mn family superoxide dismutase
MSKYQLPSLAYDFKALRPAISERQLKTHYFMHHQSYVERANEILEKGNLAAETGALTFNLTGHFLHSLYWQIMEPVGEGKSEPRGIFAEGLEKSFGSFKNFKNEFSKTALSIQGSGWAALAYDLQTDGLFILAIEKHQHGLVPGLPLVMALDVWEHAYYLDYQNNRADYIEAWWDLVDWEGISQRYMTLG